MHDPTNEGRDARRAKRRDEESVRRLAKAIVAKAIEDAAGEEPRTAISAIRWLVGHTTYGLTFEWCCEVIGITSQLRLETYEEVASHFVKETKRDTGRANSETARRSRALTRAFPTTFPVDRMTQEQYGAAYECGYGKTTRFMLSRRTSRDL